MSVDALAMVVNLAGAAIAYGLKAKELELSPNEAEMLARSGAAVLSQYSVEVDPKMAAWGSLIMTIVTIYGAKFVALRMKRAMQSGE